MGYFERFPYTNFHELNLDWLLNAMKELSSEFKAFADTNKIKYADPFNWDIASSYAPMTLVKDSDTYRVYLSRVPVPAGVELTNTNYWLEVGDMSAYGHQIDALTAGLATANTDITALKQDMEEVAATFDDLDAVTKYPAMAFSKSYAICFGDSNTMPNPPTGYGNAFNTLCSYLRPRDYKSYGISGATIQNGIGTYPVVSSQIAGANDFPASQVGLVFLMAGINDYHYGTYDATAFGSAVKSTVEAIHTKFRNALIVCAMDCGGDLPNGRMMLYNEAMKRNSVIVGSGYKVVFVPLVDFATQANLFYNANHYSSTGAYAIAARVINAIFGIGQGYTPAPRITTKSPTATAPGLNGAYNFNTVTETVIDPFNLVRRDRTRILTRTTFNGGDVTGGSSGSAIVRVPGYMRSAELASQEGGYRPATMLRSTGSYINTVNLVNVNANDTTGAYEPEIEVRLPYYSGETWTNARGFIEFEGVITILDT